MADLTRGAEPSTPTHTRAVAVAGTRADAKRDDVVPLV